LIFYSFLKILFICDFCFLLDFVAFLTKELYAD